MFQSTHPHGVRLTPFAPIKRLKEFQSTHPHGVRLKILTKYKVRLSFNPRTHTGCDEINEILKDNDIVSIHAPTRGATEVFNGSDKRIVVSIHAPTRGATLVPFKTNKLCIVSIHAPTRGATPYFLWICPFAPFQSTHPHGVRLILTTAYNIQVFKFQSTHPHGVRLILTTAYNIQVFKFQSTHPHGVRHTSPKNNDPSCDCFNPRTHTGCDTCK